MNISQKTLAGTMAVSFAVGSFALGRGTQTEPALAAPVEPLPATATLSGRALPDFSDLAAQVSPAVVHIKVVAVEQTGQRFGREFPSPFGQDSPFPGFHFPFPQPPPEGFRRRGSGSGFIIRKDGLIITNNHVVEEAKEITVTLPDTREYQATVLGRDPKTDMVVLQVEPRGELPVAQLGNSEELQVGDWVMAIGNPFGLSNTVTAGIVSAKGRVIGAGPYDDFIQTDASINPGNSGGPLFNARGEVVGINSAIFSCNGGNIGIGFAIPINLAKDFLPDLETHGSVIRGWLGVTIQPLTADLADSLEISQARGALIAEVTEEGPAAKSGMQRGDVIVTYDGKEVEESSDLPALVAATQVGKQVPAEVMRKGKTKTLSVTIAKLAEPETAANPTPASAQKGKWGLALRELRPEEHAQIGLKEGEGADVRTHILP